MKICIVGHEYPPNVISGPGRYALNLVRELERRGHKVTVITPRVRGGKSHEKAGNVEVYRLEIRKLGFMEKILPNLLDTRIMFSLKLRKFFRRFSLRDFDIVHVLDVHDSYFLDKRVTGDVPVIVSVNDYYSFETSWNPLLFPYFSTDIILRYVHYNMTKVLNSRYLRRATHVISDTAYTARSISRNVGIARNRIEVVYKGVDLRKFSGRTAEGKYKSHRILYIGSNMERKGVDDVVTSMKDVVKRFPDSRLTIIGRASALYMKKLHSIIRSSGMQDSVTIEETIAPEKIMGFYEESNLFVMAPVIEDLAQVLMESMAMRTPVVCTGVGANPEGIVDGLTGFLVPPKRPGMIADRIIRIFENPALAKKLGDNGRKRTEKMFDSSRMASETIAVYKKFLRI